MAKLASWDNAPSVEDLKADYTMAESAHKSHTVKVDAWLSNLRGEQKVKGKKGRSKIVPKLIRKHAEWRYGALSEPFLSTDDLFDARPKTFEDKDASRQNGLMLNYQFNHQIDKVKFIDEYVRTAEDEGTVVIKVGWDRETEVVEEIQLDEFGSEFVAEVERVIKNQPTYDICAYGNLVIDPTAQGDLSKAEFIIHSFETSKSELKKDGRYCNLEKIEISGNTSLTDSEFLGGDDTDFEFRDDARKKFVAYEYNGWWDVNGDGETIKVLCTWVGGTMIRMEEAPFPFERLNFVLVQYLPVRKSNYGEPNGELLEDNQRVVGAITRGMIDLMGRSANGQMGVQKNALDVINAKKFEQGDDFKFNPDVDPKGAFQMMQYPEIPRSALEMIQLQQAEAESLSGVKAFSSGVSGQSFGKVAAGIRSAMDATSKRELGILRRLSNGIVELGYMTMKMNQEWLSDEEFIRVTNEPVRILREELAGDFDIVLNISTPEADTEKAQGLEFMLQTLGNSMPLDMSQIVLADIARLRKMPALSKRIEEYKPQPDPKEEYRKELEIKLLEAKIVNEQNKGAENAADVDLKKAKTREIHSNSDKADLDFVEQESGVSRQHEEDMKRVDQDLKNEDRIVDAMVQDEQSN